MCAWLDPTFRSDSAPAAAPVNFLTRFRQHVRSIIRRDPAARSVWEIVTCYPGLHALCMHRVAHWLWQRHRRWSARWVAHLARCLTGIEIHPGATIGRHCFIDHGHGVVIGETARIGDDVTLYHGVTLGGTSWNRGHRHPTLEDHVVVGADAKLLGPITIGLGARIGSNAVVTRSVPAGATAVGNPARILKAIARDDHTWRLSKAPAFAPYAQSNDQEDSLAMAIEGLLKHAIEMDLRLAALSKAVADFQPQTMRADIPAAKATWER